VGFWASLEEIGAIWELDKSFEPSMPRADAAERRARWHQAVERARGWAI
jgi:glycerol kinase